MSGKPFPKRGEVYWVMLDPAQGHETRKRRPALIISNDIGNQFSNIVMIAPITSNTARVYQVEARAIIGGKNAKIMLQQSRAIDKSRLGARIQNLNRETMAQVERSLKIVFDLS